jgi:hypothetical protein
MVSNMTCNLYCEPCRRFLAGKMYVIDGDRNYVVFEHHDTFESFEDAMSLPCAICSFAYAHGVEKPTALEWTKLVGKYTYYEEDGRSVCFYLTGDWLSRKQSRFLSLVPKDSK